MTKEQIEIKNKKYEETKKSNIEKIKKFFLEVATDEERTIMAEALLKYDDEYGVDCFKRDLLDSYDY